MPHALPVAAAPTLRPVVFSYTCTDCDTPMQCPVPVLPPEWQTRDTGGGLAVYCPDCAAHLPAGDMQ